MKGPGFLPLRGDAVWLTAAALFAGLALVQPAPAVAQSAQEIVSRSLDAYEARLAGVEDVTIEGRIMGMAMTTRMVKEVVDDRSWLRVHSVSAMGMESDEGAGDDLLTDSWLIFDEALDRWVLEGSGSVDGRATWRLAVHDFEGLNLTPEIPGQEGEFRASRMLTELDQELLVPLYMEFDGTLVIEGQEHPFAMRMHMEDYREVEGYLHPFRTVMDMDMDLAALSGPGGEDPRAMLEELRRQLGELPEAQRQMMEQMMGEQIRMLESMVGDEGIRMEVEVLELKVNAGLPPT